MDDDAAGRQLITQVLLELDENEDIYDGLPALLDRGACRSSRLMAPRGQRH
jgi:hypothetical protein